MVAAYSRCKERTGRGFLSGDVPAPAETQFSRNPEPVRNRQIGWNTASQPAGGLSGDATGASKDRRRGTLVSAVRSDWQAPACPDVGDNLVPESRASIGTTHCKGTGGRPGELKSWVHFFAT